MSVSKIPSLDLTPSIHELNTGVIILTVSGGSQSQKMGLFPFDPPLRGDFDYVKILKPVAERR